MFAMTLTLRGCFTVAFAAVAMSALTSGTGAAGDQDFTMVNATGYTISELYVSPVI